MPRQLVRTLLLRGAILWFLARLMAFAMLGAATGGDERAGELLLPAWSLVMSAVLLLVDLHRRKELLLLNNLGVVTSHAVAVGTLPALALESAWLLL